MSSPAVCVDENLLVTDDGKLQLAPWSVPRNLVDIRADSRGDGPIGQTISLPGKMLISQKAEWHNDTPVNHMILIRVTRASKGFVVSNPNVIQFRDRWTSGIDSEPVEPTVSGIFNSQAHVGGDVGTNTVAEPNPGLFYAWRDSHSADEWVGPVTPDQTIKVWYQMYVWTPPPFSNNANKNNPVHQAYGGWARLQLMGFPQQGDLVSGVLQGKLRPNQ